MSLHSGIWTWLLGEWVGSVEGRVVKEEVFGGGFEDHYIV